MSDYDLTALRALVDPAQAPVVVVNRFIDEFEVPGKLRVIVWIKNQSAGTRNVRVKRLVDWVPAELGAKFIRLDPEDLTIDAGAAVCISELVDRPLDFIWRFSAFYVLIEEDSTPLFMERLTACCMHDCQDKGNAPAQWYTLPNASDVTQTMTTVVVVNGALPADYSIGPLPGITVTLEPGDAISGWGCTPGVKSPGMCDAPEGERFIVTLFGIVDGQIATLVTMPYVQDNAVPSVQSFATNGSTVRLVARDDSANLHSAVLFVSFDGNTWFTRPMATVDGDFAGDTAFEVSLQDLPRGSTVTLRAAVRDHPGAYGFSHSILYSA